MSRMASRPSTPLWSGSVMVPGRPRARPCGGTAPAVTVWKARRVRRWRPPARQPQARRPGRTSDTPC
eukprot:9501140-Pyramimonas_sp.AAC.1